MTCDLVQLYYGVAPLDFEAMNPLLTPCSALPPNWWVGILGRE